MTVTQGPATQLDFEGLRSQFPTLQQRVHGKPLVYLDTAATSLKPRPVIDAIMGFYERDCANIHRAVHTLSQRATEAYEATRTKVRDFIHAPSEREIVYVRGTTEAINLVAYCHARPQLIEGDEILISGLEHHSNIVPWQLACSATGARLVVAPVEANGEVKVESFVERLNDRTKIVAVNHASNALGSVNPVREIAAAAHDYGAVVLVDGAQAAAHLPIDVQELGCDFYAFSGHKVYGPTGVGVLWGRAELLEAMPPFHGGGDMIRSVTFEKTTYADVPQKFEAGTPNIAGVIGLGAALDFVSGLDRQAVRAHEDQVLAYGTDRLAEITGLRLIGTAPKKIGVLSFVMDAAHPHDIGTVVDREGVAIRTGHHCTQPLMERFEIPATARASLGLYNNRADIDALVRALHEVVKLLG